MAALTFSFDTLRTGGHLLCKFYQGAEEKAFETKLKRLFTKVHREKPDSSRSVGSPNFICTRLADLNPRNQKRHTLWHYGEKRHRPGKRSFGSRRTWKPDRSSIWLSFSPLLRLPQA